MLRKIKKARNMCRLGRRSPRALLFCRRPINASLFGFFLLLRWYKHYDGKWLNCQTSYFLISIFCLQESFKSIGNKITITKKGSIEPFFDATITFLLKKGDVKMYYLLKCIRCKVCRKIVFLIKGRTASQNTLNG